MTKRTYAPIVISKFLFDRFKERKNWEAEYSLYSFYYYTARWQRTNCPKCTIAYAAKGMFWSERKVQYVKKKLVKAGLIEDVQSRNSEGHVTGWYIRVKFIWSMKKLEKALKSSTLHK